jgi:hypothetical protein
MEDLLQMAAVEKDKAEENANAIRQEFDHALQRTEDAIRLITEAQDGETFLEGKISVTAKRQS